MSIKQFASSSDGAPPRSDNPPPKCPKCRRCMTVRQVSPVLYAANLDEMIYGCEDCGTELKRTVKRP